VTYRIADLDFTALDAWLAAGEHRSVELDLAGSTVEVTLWIGRGVSYIPVCGTGRGDVSAFGAVVAHAITRIGQRLAEAEEERAIKEEAKRRVTERRALDYAAKVERAPQDSESDGRTAK
jgi:hypothetical protein